MPVVRVRVHFQMLYDQAQVSMAHLTSQQVNDLANQFLALAQSIGDLRYYYWNDLSKEQHQLLANHHWSALHYGEDILALSTDLVMDDLSSSLTLIRELTGQIKSTLGTMTDIQEGINISAAIVGLGAAIISENPFTVEGAIEDLVKLAKA